MNRDLLTELALEAYYSLDLLTDTERDAEISNDLNIAIRGANDLVEHRDNCIRKSQIRLQKFELEEQWWNLPFDFMFFDQPAPCRQSAKVVDRRHPN